MSGVAIENKMRKSIRTRPNSLTNGCLTALRSELDHGKTGNQSEVADVQSGYGIAEMQRCGADQKVFEGNAYAVGCLLALYLPSELSDFECDWMDGHVTTQFFGKGSSALTVSITLGSVYAVSQFYDSYRREARFSLTLHCLYSFEDCSDTLATAFSCDEDAGVENQSHAERSRGLRLLMISLRSAANSASIVGS